MAKRKKRLSATELKKQHKIIERDRKREAEKAKKKKKKGS